MTNTRNDELFAKQQFNQFLQSKTSESITWKDGNQNVPPDFYLTVGQSDYVVEVTTLMEHIQTPRKIVTRSALHDSAERIIHDVKQTAQNKGILVGRYIVSFPRVEIDFYAVRKQIKKELIKFIDQTQSESDVKSTEISIEGIEYCSIQKSSTSGADVRVGFYSMSMKWEIESLEESCDLLQSAINEKAQRLANFTQPKILLLLADYGFVEPPNYTQCVSSVTGLNTFHTVFIVAVRQPSEHFLLHTSESNWK